MEDLGTLLCCLVLLVLGVGTKHAAGQPVSQVDNFLNDKENKVQLLGRHALFLQLAAESTDCGLSNCVDKCSRHACSPTTKDKFTCIKAPKGIPDCQNPGNSCAACDHLKGSSSLSNSLTLIFEVVKNSKPMLGLSQWLG